MLAKTRNVFLADALIADVAAILGGAIATGNMALFAPGHEKRGRLHFTPPIHNRTKNSGTV